MNALQRKGEVLVMRPGKLLGWRSPWRLLVSWAKCGSIFGFWHFRESAWRRRDGIDYPEGWRCPACGLTVDLNGERFVRWDRRKGAQHGR